MLIIKQRPGESFTIGNSLVYLLGIEGNQVKVGIQAHKSLSINRFKRGEKPCLPQDS